MGHYLAHSNTPGDDYGLKIMQSIYQLFLYVPENDISGYN